MMSGTAESKGAIWILQGSHGSSAHVLAIARAIGIAYQSKRVSRARLVSFLPLRIQARCAPTWLVASDMLQEQRTYQPKVIIATDRPSLAVAIGLKKSDPRCFILQIRRRRKSKRQFDLMIGAAQSGTIALIDAVHNVSPGEFARLGSRETASIGSISDIELLVRVIKARLND